MLHRESARVHPLSACPARRQRCFAVKVQTQFLFIVRQSPDKRASSLKDFSRPRVVAFPETTRRGQTPSNVWRSVRKILIPLPILPTSARRKNGASPVPRIWDPPAPVFPEL